MVLVDLLVVSAAESHQAWGEARHDGARDVETYATEVFHQVTTTTAALGPGRAADSCVGTTSNARVTLAMRDRCRQPGEAAAPILLVPLNEMRPLPFQLSSFPGFLNAELWPRVMRGSSRNVVVRLLRVRLLRFTAADAADAAA